MSDSSDRPETSGSQPPPGGAYPPPPPSGYPSPPPGNYPPGSYPPPPSQPYADYAPPPPARRNGLGTSSLVLGIVGILASWTVVVGVVVGIVGVVVGFIGRKRVARGEADNSGVALAGIVLSIVAIVLSIVLLVVFIFAGTWFWNEVGGDAFVSCMNDAGNDATAQQQCQDSFSSNVSERLSVTPTP